MQNEVANCNTEWQKIKNQVVNAYFEIYNVEIDTAFSVFLWPCTVCPYGKDFFFVPCNKEVSFYGERRILTTCLHELTHIHWWKVWQKVFQNTIWQDKKYPLTWAISEMVIDAMIKNSNLIKFIEKDYHLSHSRLYELELNNENVMQHIDKLRKDNTDLETFMKKIKNYVEENKDFFINYAH